MKPYTDALRGYAYEIHKRDHFKCRYCGADGLESFRTWLTLSWDHLLPKDHPKRDDPEFIVTACTFCNGADNHFFQMAESRGIRFTGLTPDELIKQRLPYVMKTRREYQEFWVKHVLSNY